MPSVLAILAEGFEEIEAVTPIDLLRRAGVDVTVASLGPERAVRGRNGLVLQAETDLADVLDRTFDAVFLPGGPGVARLRADARIAGLVQSQHAAGRLIAAICAAPTVLLDAGLLEGRRFTAHPSVAGELPGLLSDQAVVHDGPVLTSRGAGTSLAFGLELVAILRDPQVADEVKRSICAG